MIHQREHLPMSPDEERTTGEDGRIAGGNNTPASRVLETNHETFINKQDVQEAISTTDPIASIATCVATQPVGDLPVSQAGVDDATGTTAGVAVQTDESKETTTSSLIAQAAAAAVAQSSAEASVDATAAALAIKPDSITVQSEALLATSEIVTPVDLPATQDLALSSSLSPPADALAAPINNGDTLNQEAGVEVLVKLENSEVKRTSSDSKGIVDTALPNVGSGAAIQEAKVENADDIKSKDSKKAGSKDHLEERRKRDRQRYANMTKEQRETYNAKRREQYSKRSQTSIQKRRQRERQRYHSLTTTAAKERNERRARMERERYQRLTPEELEAKNRKRRERAANSRKRKKPEESKQESEASTTAEAPTPKSEEEPPVKKSREDEGNRVKSEGDEGADSSEGRVYQV